MKKRSIINPIESNQINISHSNLVDNALGSKRSLRRHNYVKSEIQLINCHACKTVDSALNMITCCRLDCRESFCINCIKKNYIKFNSNFFLILKEKENSNR